MPINNFTPNMPAAGNSLGFTRPLVNANFANYRENLQVNHGDVNGTNFGKHLFLTLPKQGSAPTTLVDEGAMSVREYPSSTGQMLPFFRRESNGIESGHIFLSGTTLVAVTGTFTLKDFTGYNNVYGFFEARINTAVNQVRCLIVGYLISGTFNNYYFVDSNNLRVVNTGSGTAAIGFTGNNFQIIIGAGITLPATVSWTCSGYIFAT